MTALKWEIDQVEERGRVTKDFLVEANKLLDKSITMTRTMIEEMYPRELYNFGLEQAVRMLVSRFRKHYGLDIQIITEEAKGFTSEETNILIYRSIVELLNNVVKHAQAGKVVVSLDQSPNMLKVVIEDDGIGLTTMPDLPTLKGGFGLFSIRERMMDFGGEMLTARSTLGGASISLEMPLNDGSLLRNKAAL